MRPVVHEEARAIEPARTPETFGGAKAAITGRRAEAPCAPSLPPAELAAKTERAHYLRTRQADARRSMLRGLILLAVLVLVVSLIRAGADRAFPAGWLRRW